MTKICSLVAALALVLAPGGTALAHGFPSTTDPVAGSTLKAAPHQVVINFTEAIIPRFSSLEVIDAHGRRLDENDAHLGPAGAKQLVVDLHALPAGTYKVVWLATSVDTHKAKGSFEFMVVP